MHFYHVLGPCLQVKPIYVLGHYALYEAMLFEPCKTFVPSVRLLASHVLEHTKPFLVEEVWPLVKHMPAQDVCGVYILPQPGRAPKVGYSAFGRDAGPSQRHGVLGTYEVLCQPVYI